MITMHKKILTISLALAMSISPAASVYADREDDLRQEQAWTAEQLDAAYAQIDNMYARKQQLAAEINSLDADLVNVMVSIQTLENDIAAKESDINVTKGNIKKAEKGQKKQYAAMKKRIQYLYENGGDAAWFQMMLASDDLSDMLNKAENVQGMYDYDRESLEKYANTVKEIKNLKEKYQQEKAELEGMKQEQEAEQTNLQAAIDERRASSADCDNEIAYAQQMANEYAALIEQQQAEIEQIQAEKEAARIAAEQAAAEAAAAEEAARAEAEAEAEYDEDESEDDEYVGDGDSEEDGTEDIDEEGGEDSDSEDGSYDESDESSDDGVESEGNDSEANDGYKEESGEESDGSQEESSSSSSNSYSGGSGSSVVDYATQFVGNPYVWGGTSLTNGADCSGFVQSVYNNFGVSLPRTSYEQQNAGREVSYSEAQPGDLICYGGHVAIYMGNGKIVHASNSRDGIKISDNAAYRTILSVRRLV